MQTQKWLVVLICVCGLASLAIVCYSPEHIHHSSEINIALTLPTINVLKHRRLRQSPIPVTKVVLSGAIPTTDSPTETLQGAPVVKFARLQLTLPQDVLLASCLVKHGWRSNKQLGAMSLPEKRNTVRHTRTGQLPS